MNINEIMKRIEEVNAAKPPKEWTLEERVEVLENTVRNLLGFIMKFSEYNSIVEQEMRESLENQENTATDGCLNLTRIDFMSDDKPGVLQSKFVVNKESNGR
jgi:hypothetical protein